jgi:hypothetical protein
MRNIVMNRFVLKAAGDQNRMVWRALKLEQPLARADPKVFFEEPNGRYVSEPVVKDKEADQVSTWESPSRRWRCWGRVITSPKFSNHNSQSAIFFLSESLTSIAGTLLSNVFRNSLIKPLYRSPFS